MELHIGAIYGVLLKLTVENTFHSLVNSVLRTLKYVTSRYYRSFNVQQETKGYE